MSLSGRIGLVTGAGRGIGKTTARVLCENGMAVGVNDIDSAAAAARRRNCVPRGIRRWRAPAT